MHLVIVLLVTGVAIGGRITEQLRLVAFLAFHFDMQAKQRKTRTAVIQVLVLPVLLVVAGFAARSEPTLVNIVLFVARKAI